MTHVIPRKGWDQSWGFADPAAAAKAGRRVVSGYLSFDPSKNLTAEDVKAYHAHGIAVMFNWEATTGAPLEGAPRGHEHAAAAVSQAEAIIHAVGYRPRNELSIYFSCDTDTNPSEYPKIDAYYEATKKVVNAHGFGNGCYGEYDLVNHLHARGLTVSEWQTLAWSNGLISAVADFYQSGISGHLGGADVDFDIVRHARQLGAWFPPGHPLDTPSHHHRHRPAPHPHHAPHPQSPSITRDEAEAMIVNAMRVLVDGKDHGAWKASEHPLWAGKLTH